MSEGDGNTIRWRLAALERSIDELKRRNDEDRAQSRRDKRQAFWMVSGFAVSIIVALIGSGHLG